MIESPEISIHDVPAETQIYADKLRIAKLDTNAAVLGSLNIGGVRLTIRQGVVEGRTNDIDAGNIALNKSSQFPDGGTSRMYGSQNRFLFSSRPAATERVPI